MYARLGVFGAILMTAMLAACGGGGGGGSSYVPTAAPSAHASTSPSTSPTTSPTPSANIAFTAAGTTATIPVAPGAAESYSATLTGTGSGSAVITASTAVPTTTATPAPTTLNARTRIASMRTAATHAVTKFRLDSSSGTPYTAVAYVTLTATTNVSLTTVPTITITTPSGLDAAYFDAQGFWVTLPQSGTIALAAGTSAYFALYTGGTLPSPNPDGCVGAQPDASLQGSGAHTELVGVQPIASGSSFSYTGTLTETIVRTSPCPIPTTTSQASVTVDVSMSPGPSANESYENSTETDAYATETLTTNTSALVEATAVPDGSGFAELNETDTDGSGDSTVTTYNTPLVYAVSSPVPGFSGTITNGPPSTVDASLADGTTTKRTYNSNGTYSETDTLPGGGSNVATVNSNFSGSYVITAAGGTETFDYSAPASGVITLTLSGVESQTITIPQWWTSGSALYSDTLVDKGTVTTLPSPCAPPSGTVTSADDFRRTISLIDPVLGYTETETIDAYVAGGSTSEGPACVVIDDTEDLYYDYSYDTPYALFATPNGQPLQTNTIAESYWYSSAPTIESSTRSTAESLGGVPGLAASIAAHASAIRFARAVQHARQLAGGVK